MITERSRARRDWPLLEIRATQAETLAREILDQCQDVGFVALTGATTKGVVGHDSDVDIVVGFGSQMSLLRAQRQLTRIRRRARSFEPTFIIYTWNQVRRLARRSQATGDGVSRWRRLARWIRARKWLKEFLITAFGPFASFMQARVINPATLQTWVPIHDPRGELAALLSQQRALLRWEELGIKALLYSPFGFRKLMEDYLEETVTAEKVWGAFADWDVNPVKYICRARDAWSNTAAARLQELLDQAPAGTTITKT